MKITRRQLRRIILNEVGLLNESRPQYRTKIGKKIDQQLEDGKGIGNDYIQPLARVLDSAMGGSNNPYALENLKSLGWGALLNLGTDEDKIIDVVNIINQKSANVVTGAARLAKAYQIQTGRPLDDALRSELSGDDLKFVEENLIKHFAPGYG